MGPTRIGCAVTRITELATEVNFRDVIHNAKCAARITPIPIIIKKFERDKLMISCRVLLLNTTNGIISKAVKNNLQKAIERGFISG